MIKEGYLERTIRQLRQTFARLLGLSEAEADPSILNAQLEDLYREHLGISRDLLGTLDAASWLRLLNDRAFVAAELLRGERELLTAAGRWPEAEDAARRLAQLEQALDP